MSRGRRHRWRDRAALALLAVATPPADRDALLGDLLEEHAVRGGLARESLRALPAVLALRVARGGGARACAFGCGAGLLAAAATGNAVASLWSYVLFLVPLRAEGPEPLAWQGAALVSALLAGVLVGRLACRLANALLGGRA